MSIIEIRKLGHACVRVVHDGRSVVVDPGNITREPDALTGVEAVLVTHEHPDHVDVDRIRDALHDAPDLVVHTCRGAARLFDGLGLDGRIRVVGEHDTFSAAGMTVTAVGRTHHVSHPDTAPVENVGFLFDGRVLYTGDALTDTDAPVLLVTGDAPWLTVPELLTYLRRVCPQRTLVVHDGLLNDDGLDVLDAFLERESERSGREVRRLRQGERVEVA